MSVIEVAFGVDDHDPAAVADVVEDQLGEQGGLAGAGGADDVQVMAGVGDPHPHRARAAVVVSPRGFTCGPGRGMAGGGGTERAPARVRPGT